MAAATILASEAAARAETAEAAPRASDDRAAPRRLGRTRSHIVIEVQHLTKRYGRVTAVDDVSFRVERGEILGFLGPERRRQDHDDAHPHRLHAGRPRAAPSSPATTSSMQPIEAKRRTGYLPETPPLYPDMTVREYLTSSRGSRASPPAERTRARRTR